MIKSKSGALLGYAALAIIALLWRALFLAWDFGGLFIQIMAVALWALALVAINLSELDGFSRGLINVLLVITSVLWFASAYFAIQASLPFIAVCLALLVVWGRRKSVKAKAIMTLALALPLAGAIAYGLHFSVPVYRLRHLKKEHVREIDLVRMTPGPAETAVRLTGETETEPILLALQKTTPYAPDHESLDSAWQVILELNSGEKLAIGIGKGTRANANTCRIQVGISSYQNEPLCKLLQTLAPQF